jgi:putative restriction endonuclease
MLEKYLNKFSRLRTDRNRNVYPAITYHKAPHKPFLLLSVMDLIAQGQITQNFIPPSFELVDTFNGYWNAIMPFGHQTTMAHPFPRLKTDGFWHRIANPGHDPKTDYNVTSMSKCREIYAGARLDDELFQYMSASETREQLRAVLIQSYFEPEIRPRVWEQGAVNVKSYEYQKELLAGVQEHIDVFEPVMDEKKQRIRDQGFRKAIVTLYDHRCALCGIRMLTPEGHTVVEAAHIVPWSESQDDRPTNGLCLCRLCHWSFDEGLMSVGKKYEVLVSKRVRIDQNNPGHIFTLQDRTIFRPAQENFWPAQVNLIKHRKEIFRRT